MSQTQQQTYDVDALRDCFPALTTGPGAGLARFDGPGGSLVPQQVGDAVSTTMTAGLCQRGAGSEPERVTDQTTLGARAAIGRLLGTDPSGVFFGRSFTANTMQVAATLARTWGPGDEIVVTRLDHDSNIRPWVIAAERAGATVRWLDFDPDSGELADLAPTLSDRTRLVTLTGAGNLIGTRPDVRRYADLAHEAGALVHVDAVHLAAHAPIDRAALGADIIGVSPYKFFGPHLGAHAADPELWESLQPDKLLPSTDVIPGRFELGTLPYEVLAGVSAAVEFIEEWGGMSAMAAHEDALLELLLDGLAALPGVRVYGAPARRTPTVLFSVAGVDSRAVYQHLQTHQVLAPAGNFYALEASRRLGLGDDGAVRVGLAAYSTAEEVDRLLTGLSDLAPR